MGSSLRADRLWTLFASYKVALTCATASIVLLHFRPPTRPQTTVHPPIAPATATHAVPRAERQDGGDMPLRFRPEPLRNLFVPFAVDNQLLFRSKSRVGCCNMKESNAFNKQRGVCLNNYSNLTKWPGAHATRQSDRPSERASGQCSAISKLLITNEFTTATSAGNAAAGRAGEQVDGRGEWLGHPSPLAHLLFISPAAWRIVLRRFAGQQWGKHINGAPCRFLSRRSR